MRLILEALPVSAFVSTVLKSACHIQSFGERVTAIRRETMELIAKRIDRCGGGQGEVALIILQPDAAAFLGEALIHKHLPVRGVIRRQCGVARQWATLCGVGSEPAIGAMQFDAIEN